MKNDKCMKCGKVVFQYQIDNEATDTNWKGMSAHRHCKATLFIEKIKKKELKNK